MKIEDVTISAKLLKQTFLQAIRNKPRGQEHPLCQLMRAAYNDGLEGMSCYEFSEGMNLDREVAENILGRKINKMIMDRIDDLLFQAYVQGCSDRKSTCELAVKS